MGESHLPTPLVISFRRLSDIHLNLPDIDLLLLARRPARAEHGDIRLSWEVEILDWKGGINHGGGRKGCGGH